MTPVGDYPWTVSRHLKLIKGQLWNLLETYLQNDSCDDDGYPIELFYPGTSTLTVKATARLDIINAFAQCRDKGIITEDEYKFVKVYNAETNEVCAHKYRIPVPKLHAIYNGIMHRATTAMIDIICDPVALKIVKSVGLQEKPKCEVSR